jgi:long-chain acyl-CoA synthetase
MRGYHNRPDTGVFATIDGKRYLRTGDIATIDEDGYVFIVDRLKDMIAVGGFKVFPSALEGDLYQHPAVREAIVIGIPDTRLGERPKAFVTLKPGATATGAELLDWLNAQVGKHERAVAVEVRDELPKTMIGKLSRKELVAEERAKAAQAEAKA